MKKLKVYIASPFFNKEQIERLTLVENEIEPRFDAYSPRKQTQFKSGTKPDKKLRQLILDSNLYAIENSDFVIAITDDKDLGTLFEVGYAYAIGKPIIYVAFTLGERPFNLMLSETGVAVLKTLSEVRTVADSIIKNGIYDNTQLKKFQYEGLIE
ncbi:MAG: nucleoside 2-deoxyribosyltransferase [Candidatus Hodarchaeota archaeon]